MENSLFQKSIQELQNEISKYQNDNQIALLNALHFLENTSLVIIPEINYWSRVILTFLRRRFIICTECQHEEVYAAIQNNSQEGKHIAIKLPINFGFQLHTDPQRVLGLVVRAVLSIRYYTLYFLNEMPYETFYQYNTATLCKATEGQINFLRYCNYFSPATNINAMIIDLEKLKIQYTPQDCDLRRIFA